ncbi:glycosyltransferase family 2 protein [Samsonia erythrinae]|uniref:GT2 family glycosyltransferase n=1 Tax=Samsonia erythrinae TaxID=160434 RepID=A0A4R3VU71_9GAMM|nr:glycosyltransferase family A protein [Samsonia erythrinae]TCV08956.1 GT2 family glycosyltransferase [Samsonia erythrinae]
MNNQELISVCVITYNSECTVKETLDSIYNQTYGTKNIELIISDDASKDNTVLVINEWLKEKTAFFSTVHFYNNPENLGVPGNCNTAWKAATAEWIKTIAGDDILLPNCLAENYGFSKTAKPDVGVIFSYMQPFSLSEQGMKVFKKTLPTKIQSDILKESAHKQNTYLRVCDLAVAPTSFIRKKALEEIGYADKRFRLIEDLPLWYKFTKNGWRLSFLDQKTVLYRVSNSIMYSDKRLVNVNLIHDLLKIDYELCKDDVVYGGRILHVRKLLWLRSSLLIAFLFNNKANTVSNFFIMLSKFLKPYGPSHFFLKLRGK